MRWPTGELRVEQAAALRLCHSPDHHHCDNDDEYDGGDNLDHHDVHISQQPLFAGSIHLIIMISIVMMVMMMMMISFMSAGAGALRLYHLPDHHD